MAPGYIDIITLPIGSTSILIQENKPTNNYLGRNFSTVVIRKWIALFSV